jgi:D-threo-aldose 1-dehydrogenase
MSLPVVDLGGTGIKTTTLGFGCATLFRVPDAAERLRLLHVAYEAGIRHFDVAPMYGLGRAEPELGSFIRSHRSEVTVATKFGIRPTLAGRCFAYVQRPVRRILRSKPAIGDQVRAHAAAPSSLLYERGGYDAVNAKRSLRKSLRRLRTDYVDLLLLHDPIPGSVRSAETRAFLEDARTAGLIRSWGIAGAPEVTLEVALSFRQVPVQQVRSHIFASSFSRVPDGSALITFGVISSPLARIVQHVRASEAVRERWCAATGADCGDPEVTSSFLLRAAFQANSSGVVLFGATRPPHIGAASAVAEQSGHLAVAEKSDLDSFMNLVQMELLMPDSGARRTS